MRTVTYPVSPIVGLFIITAILSVRGDDAPVSFNREIRPLLAGNCFECHGPDEGSRKAKLRLDRRDAASQFLKVDGELQKRISSSDPDEIMPPPESKRTLEPDQIALIRRWIGQGAPYETHWAFVPPQRPEIPEVQHGDWPRNPIDHFILRRLEEEGLAPSPEADRYTLIRRLYLDLIGLPPAPEEADAFARDPDPKAYENRVDSLLGSSHYGERWARPWLDLARYSDTNGYEKDRPRSIWPYRDWVVNALNNDMPFDQFSVEQLAGDLLPEATLDQRVATGFHRNTMLNEEGGIDPLEFRFYAMVDRVATTGTVWLGMTTGCAQCHTHKYDPISHTDYYRLMALLNNADEPDLDVPNEGFLTKRSEIDTRLEALERAAMLGIDQADFDAWFSELRGRAVPWNPLHPDRASSNLPRLEIRNDASVFASGDFTKRDVYQLHFPADAFPPEPVTAIRLEALPDDSLPAHGPGAAYYEGRRGDFFLSELTARHGAVEVRFSDGSHSFGKLSVGSGNANATNVLDGKGSTGWSTSERPGEPHHLVLNFSEPFQPRNNIGLEIELLFERHFVAALGRFRFSVTTATGKPVALPSGTPDPLSASEETMRRHYLNTAPAAAVARKEIETLRPQRPDVPTTLVMSERPPDNPRNTHRHHRGEYLSPREEVSPGVPVVFEPLPEGQPSNRLTLAKWLVSERNPLVGRVTVNRAWQTIFGRGLVESPGDFGIQSAGPSHPELLDWLATEFVRDRWSMKRLHRLLTTSAAYRQTSVAAPQVAERDPDNRLLARGPRFRVEAEMIRDIALAASGLLSDKAGGPGVYPPQPAGVTALAYGSTAWTTSAGEDRFRRSLYTISKRTAPFAAYSVFDAPSGETCIARRNRSNTPLQSLTLLNDEMFLEMARALAEHASAQNGTDADTARDIFRRCVTRPPADDELALLLDYYRKQKERFESGAMSAVKLLARDTNDAALAAWTLVARAVLNLDETITKQ